VEHITTRFDRGTPYPLVLRHDLIAQVPSVKKKFLHFRDYQEKTLEDIFTPEQLQETLTLNAFTLETSLWLSTEEGTFKKETLPKEVQFFPVYALLIEDFTGDEIPDILLGGNQHRAKPETGIYAGGYGLVLKGDGKGKFEALAQNESGLSIVGDIRALGLITCGDQSCVLAAKNNSSLELYDINYKNDED
jgi:enediyne biosynthesis protein E4